MKEKENVQQSLEKLEMSRRAFFKKSGVATAAAVITATAVTGCSTSADADTSSESTNENNLTESVSEESTGAQDVTAQANGGDQAHGSVDRTNYEATPNLENAQPIMPEEAPAAWDMEAEFIVVGAGGGGINAVARLASKGASVTCIEKSSMAGGNAVEAAGYGVIGGAKLQNEAGWDMFGDPFDPMRVVYWGQDGYNWSMDTELLYTMASRDGEMVDWMSDECGVAFAPSPTAPIAYIPEGATPDHCVKKDEPIIMRMYDYSVEQGGEYVFNTAAETLIVENARVVGVKATDSNGNAVYCHGTKGVLLTAGGFCNNQDMLKKYIPSAYEYCNATYLSNTDTGECVRMGLGVGADTSGYNTMAVFDGVPDWRSEGGDWVQYLYNGSTQLTRQPWLTIDKTGSRLPYLEARADNPRNLYNLSDLAAVQMSVPGHKAYIVFDSDYETNAPLFEQIHCRTLIEPDMGNIEVVPEHFRDWRNGANDAIEADVIKKRDTLEELEADLGLREGILTSAVEKWNKNCEAGADDFCFPMRPEYLKSISKPPYYGSCVSGNLYATNCGLLINPQMQVIDTEGEIIPGLYAAWHTAGGAAGESVWSMPCGGSIIGDVALAQLGGYLAGDNASELEG